MGFIEAVRSGLSNYVTFSGRARRSEYWWFALFVFLGAAVLGMVDAAIFGTNPETGQSVSVLAALFQLATFLPLLAVGWRRMHDAGYPGWYLLLPMVVSVLFMFSLFSGVFAFSMLEANAADPSVLRGPAAVLGLTGMMVAAVVQLILFVLIIWWLTRPSQPGPNEYGAPV